MYYQDRPRRCIQTSGSESDVAESINSSLYTIGRIAQLVRARLAQYQYEVPGLAFPNKRLLLCWGGKEGLVDLL
jgi:hypothetical protein